MNRKDYLPPGVPALTPQSTLSDYWFDTEKREQRLVRRFVRPGMTFFDVGAHIGRYTRLFSVAAGPAGRVFAFEPTPATATKLARAIREEKMENVELIRAAVSDQSGTAIMHLFPEEYSTWNGLGTPRMEDPKDHSKFVPIASEVPVQAIRLDEFCRERGISHIDYFKLDVEGVEYQALIGLEEMLKRQAIGALQFEVSKKMLEGLNTTAAPVFKLLAAHGYECHSIGEQGEIGPVVSDSDSFYENYIALPARSTSMATAASSTPAQSISGNSPKFSFVTIVLNGMPFLEPALRAVYDFAHEIIIVEGAVQNCRFAANPDGSSVDGTIECIRRFPDLQKKIRLIQGVWPEKCEMQNAALPLVTGDYVWLMDSDEIYRREDLQKVADLVRREPAITQLNVIPDNFWKGFDHLMISPFFFQNEAHYRRIFKFKPGAVFTSHRPPTLVWPGETRSTEQMNCIPGEITRVMGIIPFHYSYVVESQVAQKIELYNRYGWGKDWQVDMNLWFRQCWQAWTPENRQEIESCWPVWTGGKGSRTVPFTGEHPEVMKEFIAAFRWDAAAAPKKQSNTADDRLHEVVGSKKYLEMTLAGWQHIQLDAPVQRRVTMIREAIANGRSFWNNHVAFAFLADRLKPTTYLEVGVRIGASMVQVLTHAPIKVAAGVDLWAGEYAGLPNTREFATAQLNRHSQATGKKYEIHLLQGNSHKVLKDLVANQCEFNLINVDGDHSDEGAMQDLEDALRLLTPRGAILFDDIIHPSHHSLLNVIRTFAARHPELTLLLNTRDDNGVAILLRGVSVNELLPELAGPAKLATSAAAPKGLKVAEDYAQEKDLTKIDGDSEFARAIRNLFKIYQPRRIIETGTYLGTGTTRVIAETLRDLGVSDAKFHSIEINPDHFTKAQANLRAAGLESFVNLQHGLSVPRQMLPTVNQIEESTVRSPEFEGIFVDHREAQRAKLYFAETNFSGCPEDLLGRALGGFNNQPDFVLLDSGGHMGFVEFQYLIQKLSGPCFIALDDIHHIKHHKSFQFMQRDSRFEILVESKEKFGFCIAQFTPAAAESNSKGERILWVRTDSIGDAVLASAMLEPIRKKYPEAKLAVLCQQHVAELFVACPFVDSIICYDGKKMQTPAERAEIISEIAAFQPSLILNSVRSRDVLSNELTLAFSGARHIAIEGDLNNISEADHASANARYDALIPTPEGHKPELGRHADFLRGLGIEVSNLQPVVWTSPENEALADAFFAQQGLNPAQTIAIFPGAQHAVRLYSGYAEALKTLDGFCFLIFGDATQKHLAEKLEAQLPGRTVNLCGRSTLGETAALVRRCRLYVGAESAGAHIACAVGVPNVVLLGGGHFGRFMPYSPLSSSVCLPLDCYGCDWHCEFASAHCITSIMPEVLAAAITETLRARRNKPTIFVQTNSKTVNLPSVVAAKLNLDDVELIPVTPSQPMQVSWPSLHYGAGVHKEEGDFRWLDTEAELLVNVPEGCQPVNLSFELRAGQMAWYPLRFLCVEVVVAGHTQEQLMLQTDHQFAQVRLQFQPAAAPHSVRIRTDQYFTADDPGRRLTVQLRQVRMVETKASVPNPATLPVIARILCVKDTQSPSLRLSADGMYARYEEMFPEVGGWLMWEAVQTLHFLNKAQIAEGITGNFAEIGAYRGKFTLAMMTFLDPDRELLLVNDIFDLQTLNTSRSGIDATFAAFNQNLFQLDPNPHYVRVFQKRSDALLPAELGTNIRFFSVDGGHSCEETCNDLRLAAQTLHPHGMIVLDDYFNKDWPGVEAGVRAYFQAYTDLAPLMAFYNKFIFVKRESRAWFEEMLKAHEFAAFCQDMNWSAARHSLHGFDYYSLAPRPASHSQNSKLNSPAVVG